MVRSVANVYQDLVKAMNANTYVQVAVLQALFRREQLKESQKVPTYFNTFTVLIPGNPTTVNVNVINALPRNPKRSGFSMQNTGSASVYWAGKVFDYNEVSAQLTGQGAGVVNAGVLAANGQASVPSGGPLFVCATSTGGTQLTLTETLFLEDTKDSTADADQWHGYRNVGEAIASVPLNTILHEIENLVGSGASRPTNVSQPTKPRTPTTPSGHPLYGSVAAQKQGYG